LPAKPSLIMVAFLGAKQVSKYSHWVREGVFQSEVKMIILKLAGISAALYLLIALLMQSLLIMLAHLDKIILIRVNRLSMGLFFGLIWIVSFSVAWHVMSASLSAKFPPR
jgi:hypothetical protein